MNRRAFLKVAAALSVAVCAPDAIPEELEAQAYVPADVGPGWLISDFCFMASDDCKPSTFCLRGESELLKFCIARSGMLRWVPPLGGEICYLEGMRVEGLAEGMFTVVFRKGQEVRVARGILTGGKPAFLAPGSGLSMYAEAA